MRAEKMYYHAADVCAMLEVSKSKAYQIIREVNDEMKEKGYLVIGGKVNKKYFDEKMYVGEKRNEEAN